MKPKFRLLAVLVLTATVGVVSLVSTAAGTQPSGKHVEVIDLTTRTVQEAEIDLGATGFGLGDRFVFTDDVFRGTENIGTLGGECTAVRLAPYPLPAGQEPTSVSFHCAATLSLPKGQVTFQGLVTFSEQAGPSFTIAITGGTGAYRTAHGQATITESEEEDAPSQMRLELIR
jgi:hypothetical protein